MTSTSKARESRQKGVPLGFDLEGMIDLFGRAVFASPLAVIRELIQNAHDACVVREKLDPERSGKSEVSVNVNQWD